MLVLEKKAPILQTSNFSYSWLESNFLIHVHGHIVIHHITRQVNKLLITIIQECKHWLNGHKLDHKSENDHYCLFMPWLLWSSKSSKNFLTSGVGGSSWSRSNFIWIASSISSTLSSSCQALSSWLTCAPYLFHQVQYNNILKRQILHLDSYLFHEVWNIFL